MFDFAANLTFPSVLAYVGWRAAGRRRPVGLRLKSGLRFELRDNSCGNNDYGIAYEIFVHDYYNDHGAIASEAVELVVDLGVNVGLSLLYFLHRYPGCRIIGFEPHPRHVAQAERNLLLDGSRARVELHAKAAGARSRPVQLTDLLSSSALVEDAGSGTIATDVVDIFPLLEGRKISLLKMDIEGGEYEILADPRFDRLVVGSIVMEWHSRGGGLEDKRWCEQRLQGLGFTIEEIFTAASYGMFWARRPSPGR